MRTPIPNLTPKEVQRFWSKIDKTDTCWNWIAGKNQNGYGLFDVTRDGKYRKIVAHRVSYYVATGEDPSSKDIDHVCHNRSCVNPGHLRACTHKENAENRVGANANNKSGILGVCWNKAQKKWRASMMHEGKKVHGGDYLTIEEAADAVAALRIKLYTHNDIDRREAA